jgi:tetratricopeptide (TPR) repeat protein
MLPASNDGPKKEPASAPTPTNWKGVRHGLNHAEQCLKDQQFQQAELLIREVLEFAPAEAKAWDMLSLLHQMQGRHAEAAKCRDKAAKLLKWETDSYRQPPASIRLAKLLWQQGDKDTARAMLAVLMLRRPEDERLQALRQAWARED